MRRLVLILCALCAASAIARAYCLNPPLRKNSYALVHDVPVYLVAPGAEFAGLDKYVVAHQLEVAVDNWHEEAGANIRPYFAGILSSAGVPTDGTVYVKQSTNCSQCTNNAPACEQDYYYGGFPLFYKTGSTVWIVDKEEAGSSCDNPFTIRDGGYWDLIGMFTHELGHSWGIDDEYPPHDCDGYVESVMSGVCGVSAKYLTRRDIGSLQAHYGPRVRPFVYTESADFGLSWFYGSPQDPPYDAFLRLGTRGYAYGGGGTEVYAQAMLNYGTNRGTKVWKGSPGQTHAFVQPDNSSVARSWDVASAAYRDATHYAIAYRYDEQEWACNKGIRLAITDDGGSSWTHVTVRSGESTQRSIGEGVALTYDPASSRYVVVYPNNFDEIEQTTFQALPPHGQGAIYTLFKSDSATYNTLDQPVMACNSTFFAGSENCMLAWLDDGDWNGIQWARGHIATTGEVGRFIPGAAYTTPRVHGYAGWQSPSLGATANWNYPWLIGIKQGSYFYTWRYQNATDSFVDARLAFDGTPMGVLSGSLAELYTGGRLEEHVKGATD